MPASGKSSGRFELPQLTPLNFSLTDGTSIPPPPDSPIEEPVPASKDTTKTTEDAAIAASALATHNGNGNVNGHGVYGRADDTPPMSPTSTKQGSIRRFISRKSLNTNYVNGTNDNASQEDLVSVYRPESAMSFASGRPGLMKKNSSGSWFKRLGSSSGRKRSDVILEEKNLPVQHVPAPAVTRGPPPPKLPELNQLKARIADDDGGSLGKDLFKNIK